MRAPASARRALLAVALAGAATLIASRARPAAAGGGGIITLVAQGAQDVYLTAGPTATGEEAAVNTANVRRDVLVDPDGTKIVDPATGVVIEPHP